MLALWFSMVRVCESILSSREDAEDCASEALMDAMSYAGPAPVGNREAWCVSVAKRRAVDHLRHRIRSRARAQRLLGHGEFHVPDVAEAVADASEARWLSRQAAAILTQQARAVLDVVASGGSVDSAANRLGITRRSAESHLHRARVSLRAHALRA